MASSAQSRAKTWSQRAWKTFARRSVKSVGSGRGPLDVRQEVPVGVHRDPPQPVAGELLVDVLVLEGQVRVVGDAEGQVADEVDVPHGGVVAKAVAVVAVGGDPVEHALLVAERARDFRRSPDLVVLAEADRAADAELVARLGGDEVHDAARLGRAVEHRRRTPQRLDALDVAELELADAEARGVHVAAEAPVGVAADAVENEVALGESAGDDARVGGARDPGDVAIDVVRRRGDLVLDQLPADHLDGRRRVQQGRRHAADDGALGAVAGRLGGHRDALLDGGADLEVGRHGGAGADRDLAPGADDHALLDEHLVGSGGQAGDLETPFGVGGGGGSGGGDADGGSGRGGAALREGHDPAHGAGRLPGSGGGHPGRQGKEEK